MSSFDVWLTIILLGIGTYFIRYSFIGLIGSRQLPEWALRHLRYVPVAVMPGLIAPLVAWPAATGGNPDPARLFAAAVALIVGAWLRNVLWAVISGLCALYLGLFVLF